MRKFNKRILSLFLSTAMLVSLAACNKTKGDEKKSGKEGKTEQKSAFRLETLKLQGETNWGMSNPFLQDPRGPGTSKVKMIFDSLLDEDEKGIISWLAKEWKVEGDEYIFKIYENAKWHDGKPLTTEDIGFSIDYYRKHNPINSRIGTGDKMLVKSYKIVSPTEIRIKAAKQNANTLKSIGGFLIIPKHIWEKVENPKTFTTPEAFIGSGPYKWGKYDGANGSYEFIANEEYYGRKPVAKRVLFVPVSDPLLAFENGEIDITNVPVDLMDKYKKNDKIGMIEKTNDSGYKLILNMDKQPAFKDINARKALYYALNRQSIADKVFRGLAVPASAGYVPVTNAFYTDKVEKYNYEPAKAKEILSPLNINVEILSSNSGSDIKIMELIKNDLEAAGVKVTLKSVDGKTRDEKVLKHDFQFALVGNGGWGRTPDYLRTLFSDKSKYVGKNPHSMGPVGYSNEAMTKLAEDQLLETNMEKRKELLQELQVMISKEVPLIVITTQSSFVMFKKDYYKDWVKTYDYQQLEQNRMSYVEK